jgi:hypothetical protein
METERTLTLEKVNYKDSPVIYNLILKNKNSFHLVGLTSREFHQLKELIQ